MAVADASASGMYRPRWLSAFLFPFESRFSDIGGCRLHYVDEGKGPVLLMLHGYPTWSFLYRNLIRGLSSRFRCIAVDYPGFGLSTAARDYDHRPQTHAQVIAELVRKLDLRRVTLMAHEWGGPIGLAVAAREPGRFRALVLSNTWAWPVDGARTLEWGSRFFGGAAGTFLTERFAAIVNFVMWAGTRRHRLPPEVVAAYRGPFATPASRAPLHVLPREIIGSRTFLEEVASRLPALANLPTLLLWGGGDPAFGARELRRFEATFATAHTVKLLGAGHFVQEDAPDEIVAAVRRFWADRMELS